MKRIYIIITMLILINISACDDRNRYTIYVWGENVQGLSEKSKVTYKGLDIGVVSNLELKNNGLILLTLKIDKDVRIPVNSDFIIKSQNILNDKNIEISYGNENIYFAEKDTVEKPLKEYKLNINVEIINGIIDESIKKEAIRVDSGTSQ